MPQLRPSTAKKANKSKRKKKNELQIYATTWMTLKGIVLSKNKVHPKGDKFWVFIGRADAEAETLVLWPPHAKS